MFGDITVKSRPLRLAFIIPPNKAALQRAIEVNSSLWGGSFNPIIPLYVRPLKAWKLFPREKISVEKRVLGYIQAFDPDVLVNCLPGELPAYLRRLNRPIVSVDGIWAGFSQRKENTPAYGVGVFELLNSIYEEYFETVRRFPVKVLFPELPQRHQLLWAAAIGKLPEDIQQAIEHSYEKAIDIEKPKIEPSNYADILKPEHFFTRRLTQHKLTITRAGRWIHESYGFYMDADKFVDIVDFWNLRALGRSVIPIPKQFADDPQFLKFVREFIKANYREDREGRFVSFGTSIVRSFSSTMPELERLAKALELQKLIPDKPNARLIGLQHWYPRIWDEWAIGKDGARPANVYSEEESLSFPDTDGSVRFNVVKPPFAADFASDSPRYANEIYPKFYGEADKLLADVMPYDHGENVLRLAGGSGSIDEIRIGRTGLIHLVQWRNRYYWKVPLGEEVFFAWLKDKGFEPQLSTCGRLAKEIHSQLQGWLAPLTNETFVDLLEKMNRGGEEGKGLPLGQVKNVLQGNLYRSLVARGVFKLGYKTQCTHCLRTSWHSVESFASDLVCPLCHKNLDAISAVDSENQGAWHLKTAGPFSVSNYGDGSYTVLLTLNFFKRDMSLQRTPVLSFTAKDTASGNQLEADLALFWQDLVFGEQEEGLLFAECKSYNQFQTADFERMRALAKRFPGAILVFSTLRNKLRPRELRQLKRITREGMKRWKVERPLNPVLILTGRELFSLFGAPHCWDGVSIPDWAKHNTSLLNLCNATQAIYLGAPHWSETWQKEFEERRKRRKATTR